MEGTGRKTVQNESKNKFKFNIPSISKDGEQYSQYKASSLFKAHQQAKQQNHHEKPDNLPESGMTTCRLDQQLDPNEGKPINSTGPVGDSSELPKWTMTRTSRFTEKSSEDLKRSSALSKGTSNSHSTAESKGQNLSGRPVGGSSSKLTALGTSKTCEKSEQADEQLLKVTPGSSLSSIIINPRQRGNPIIKHIRNVPWQYGDCVADYVLGRSTCALFLSLRYHSLHPDYIHTRMKDLGKSFELRILLVQVDVQDPHHSLKELAKICILADCTLILAWSAEEVGRYLEVYKAYENKPPDLLMERSDQNFLARMTDCLTTVKSVNKTNVVTLLDSFKSFEKVSDAGIDDLSICPGFGPQKARRLYEVFHTPFIKSKRKPEEKESDTSSSPNKQLKAT